LRLKGQEYGYAISSSLDKKKIEGVDTPMTTVMHFETTDLVRNAQGDPATSPNPDRHGKGRTETYVDGHAKFVRSGETSGFP